MKHVRPSKKKVAELKKQDRYIPTKAELKKDDKIFQKLTAKLKHLVRRKKVTKNYKDDVLDHAAIKRKAKRVAKKRLTSRSK